MNIDTLHEYAIRLKKLGLLQIAGDIDYLIAWLKSPEFNNGFHLPPHPAGENTYDEYSHHCPIPFIQCRTILKRFVNNCEALNLIGSAKDIITELLSEYTSDLEQTAIQAYIDYTDNLINVLSDEESDPPIPPDPPHGTIYIIAPDTASGESCSISAIHNGNTINPQWTISPEGPTISNNTLSFTESGIYTLQASYSGVISEKQIKLEYKPGWSTDTVIDDTGDYPVSNTTTTDPEGNKEEERVAYIDGESVNVGFDIIPNEDTGTVNIQDGKDTKVYAFDGTNGFELYFGFHVDPAKQPVEGWVQKPDDASKQYVILNMKRETAPYPGIQIRMNNDKRNLQFSITPEDPNNPGQVLALSYNDSLTSDNNYNYYIRYDPSAVFEKLIIKNMLTGNIRNPYDFTNVQFNNEVTATIGYVNFGTIDNPIPCRQCDLDVSDFRLNKIMINTDETPTVTIDNSNEHLPYLITSEVTNDENHIIKKLVITPNRDVTEDEYVCIEDGIITDVCPFEDGSSFELEMDIKVSYSDQDHTLASSERMAAICMTAEDTDAGWPGYSIGLINADDYFPSDSRPNGALEHRVRYNQNRALSRILKPTTIPDDYTYHATFMYDASAQTRKLAEYSYTENKYVVFTVQTQGTIPNHDWPLCIGCALDDNRQKFRLCRIYVKNITYKRSM